MSTLDRLSDDTARNLLRKVSSRAGTELVGYVEEKELLISAINDLIEKQKSGSVLVYGEAGSGKTLLVNHCIKECTECKVSDSCVKVIKLDQASHATLNAALLAVGKAHGFKDSLASASTVGKKLENKSKRSKKSYILVLENFEMFCRNQERLIYTLFDTVQNVDGHLLIGLTRRGDCVESAEKRVRSRISSKSIHLKSPFKSEDEYIESALKLLDNKVDAKSLRPLLAYQYSLNSSFEELRHFLTNLLLNRKKLTQTGIKDPVVVPSLFTSGQFTSLIDLTQLELAFLCLFSSQLKDSKLDTVRLVDIYPKIEEFSFLRQIYVSKELSFFVVNRLIDYGLVKIDSSHKTSMLYLNDFTNLRLNVPREELVRVLNIRESSLPTKFLSLLSL